ncbi:MAG: glycosyl hydrolase family 18 protein [Bacteroidota bacterium]
MKTKLRISFLVCVLMVLVAGTGSNLSAQSSIWVTAYYAGWQQNYQNNGYMPAQNVDYTAMTHICHFALIPNSDGSVDDQGNSVTAYNAGVLIPLAHAKGVKVIITIGGWGTEPAFMSATAAGTLPTFVSNIVNIMTSRGYDGVDIDWEPLSSGDAANYSAFVTALRTAMDNAGAPTNTHYLLTMATQWSAPIAASVANQMDQINLMTYDIAGLWPGWVTWHNSALYNDISIGSQTISCDGYVKKWNAAGVPLNKLGIGIDWYGYKYSGATGPRQSISGASLVQGNRPYYTIMASDYPSMTRVWDAPAGAVYLTSSSGWVTYDDQQSCKAKINYAQTQGIGGVIIWELGGGYRASLPAGQRDSLLQAVKQAMGGLPSDTIAPVVAITSPLNGATVSNTITVSATASDNVSVAGVQFQLNGGNLGGEVTIPPYNYSWNTGLKANGGYTLSAIARDAAGNKTTSSISVTISNVPDTTAPSISITAPTDGANVSGTVTITANASDNVGVVGVQFKLNGTNCGSEVTTPPYAYSWNTTQNSNGVYSISATARDAAGNTSTAAISVTDTNTTPPPGVLPFEVVSEDNFNRPDQLPIAGAKWTTLANQPGNGALQLVNQSVQAYCANGVGYGGGMAWDTVITKGSGVTLTVAQRSGDNTYTSLFLYARMQNKDLSTGNGYRFRYLDNSTGNALLAIQKVTNGTNGTDLVTTNHTVNVGDTLKFVVENDANNTLVGYVNSTLVLSVVDTTYNPSSWYFWVRGMVTSTPAQYDHFAVISQIPGILPIQLSSFSAHAAGATEVDLDWTTMSEVNNYGFYIERRLESQSDFSTVGGFIPGAGTSLQQHQYSLIDTSVTIGTYHYRLKQIDLSGKFIYSTEIVVTVTGVLGVKDNTAPRVFQLLQNYPNPFNPTTTINFTVQNVEHAQVVVYNVVGQEVMKLFEGVAEPGRYYNLTVDGSRLGSGVYLYRIKTDSHMAVRKMLLIK